jgi:potassium efflux system protein
MTPIRLFHAFFLLLTLLLSAVSVSAALDPEISKQIDEFDKRLSQKEIIVASITQLTIEDLKDLGRTADEIKSKVKVCIASNEASIAKVDEDLALLGEATKPEDKDVTKKRKSLAKGRGLHEAQLATCQLLVLRSTQLFDTAQKKEQALIASQLLTQNKTLVQHFRENIEKPKEGFNSLVDFVVSSSGLDIVYKNRYLMFLFIVVSIVGTLLYRRLIKGTIALQSEKTRRSFARKLYLALLTCSKHFILAFLLTASFAIYFIYIGLSSGQFPFVGLVTIGLFLYVLLTFTLRLILDPIAPAVPLTGLETNVARTLDERLRLLAKLLFVGFLIFSASNLHEFPDFVTGLLRNIYITLVVLNLCWAFWLLGYVKGMSNSHFVRAVIILIFLISMFADWAGYNNLSSFILIGISGSILAWMLTAFIATLWTEFFNSLDDGTFAWQRSIRRVMGVQPGEYLPGSAWFRFVFGIVVWTLFAIAMLKIWGMPDQNMLIIKASVIDGFSIGSYHIVPSRLLFALLMFAVLLSLVGWIKRRLQKSWLNRSRMDRGGKESLVALTGYVGVVLAFIVGLVVAGVELANLALIAGALSVGIGFGLQNVVNNFVSGIVLLFERPIKTGDWIMVGLTQGNVKKINLRSTIIQTFERADVIVPNAEIIGNQVTNMMLNDPVGRVKVPIGVAYGTNPRKVEKILLDIALEHPMVVSRSPAVSAPWVAFRAFGDSSLLFELRFFISDIDYYTRVLSEINFSIAEAFQEAGIVIPFPQRDIHLISGEQPAKSGNK